MTGEPTVALAPLGLRCEHLAEPLGIDERAPLLSWRLASTRRGDAPARYRVQVWDEDGTPAWDTGEVGDPAAVSVRYAGVPLSPRTRYRWQIAVTAEDGATGEAGSWFETGQLAPSAWRASWITHDTVELDVVDAPEEGELALADHGLSPAARLRRPFETPSAIVHVPTGDPGGVRESGVPVSGAPGIRILGTEAGTLLCRVTSGDYRFTADDPLLAVP